MAASLLPKQIHAKVNKTEFKTTMTLPDVLSEHLGYGLKPRQLPHNLKVLYAPTTRLPAKNSDEV